MKHPQLEKWQYQPVHNTYLLIFSELGAIGFVFFVLFILYKIREIIDKEKGDFSRDLTYLSICIIIPSFLFISFFDHYFWDIKLGVIIFVLPIMLFRSYQLTEKNKLDKNL